MSDQPYLQVRIRDVFRSDEKTQEIEVLRDGEVLGRLPGVTSVDYAMAIGGLSKVTLDLIISGTEITTR